MDALAAASVESLDQEGASCPGEVFQLRLRHIQPTEPRQIMNHFFPCATVILIVF